MWLQSFQLSNDTQRPNLRSLASHFRAIRANPFRATTQRRKSRCADFRFWYRVCFGQRLRSRNERHERTLAFDKFVLLSRMKGFYLRENSSGGSDIGTASLFGLGFFVSSVELFQSCLFARLRNMSSSLGKVFTFELLLVDDFFVVGYVSWIGHARL
jgi:hypothetical protein